MRQRFVYLQQVLALAVLYVVAARAGLKLDAVAGFATLVWAPTGIALAALLLLGIRLWPGVAIGAGVANILTGAPLLVALGIAGGNTLEAVVGAYALTRIPGFRTSLDRVTDVLGLILLAAAASATIAATVGVSSLYVGGIVSTAGVGETWRAWWLGDLMGALLVAPVLLVWIPNWRLHAPPLRVLEAAGLSVCVITASVLIFRLPPGERSTLGAAYMFFPLLIWTVLRFGQRGGVAATFVISLVAVWATVLGHGPFIRPVLYQSLLALQTFLGVVATTFLVLGASVSERRRAMADLEVASGEQKRLHETAAEANRAKAEFMAVMSHELRTPLNAIGGYADLLALGLQGPLTEKQLQYVSRIQRNEEHLLMLIDEVLGFARIEAGRLSVATQVVPVQQVIESIETLIETELRKKNLAFNTIACDASLSVRADPDKLRQILLNLLMNAIKFTDSGGAISVGALPDRDAEPALDTDGAMIRIWVRDTGIGIPAGKIKQVLEPFFQVDRGTTRRYPGVGLGLSIARDLARAMNGDLHLESVAGQGTTAALTLPSG